MTTRRSSIALDRHQVNHIRTTYRRLGTTRKVAAELGYSPDTIAKYTRDIETSRPQPMADLAWQEQAACRGYPVELFFPSGYDKDAIREAKAVCVGCPVLESCHAWAVTTGSVGIWGGRAIGLIDGRRDEK